MLPLSLPAIWDEEHVKALLGLRRHPTRLVYAEPWRAWMEERGGALNLQGQLALRQSDLGTARKCFEEAQDIYEKLGDQLSLSYNRIFLEQLETAE